MTAGHYDASLVFHCAVKIQANTVLE